MAGAGAGGGAPRRRAAGTGGGGPAAGCTGGGGAWPGCAVRAASCAFFRAAAICLRISSGETMPSL